MIDVQFISLVNKILSQLPKLVNEYESFILYQLLSQIEKIQTGSWSESDSVTYNLKPHT